ncbi:MAG: tRNA pseudouridine(13) synthase TruD [Campylobacteraceae bacterium]
MNRLFFMSHSPIKQAHFSKNSSDFIVDELPLYEFSGSGEHLVLHVRKKDLTTWQMLNDLSDFTGAKLRDFGYAGLKDKDGMTVQYISIHKNYEEKLKSFSHEKVKILNTTYHNNKIKIGHLKGNRFFIRLKKVLPTDALKITNACEKIKLEGYPNYFGYQRFGKGGNNYEDGKAVLLGKKRENNKKIRDFLISAYQSELFNRWLSKRIEISKLFESFDVNEMGKILPWDKGILKEIKKQPQFFKMINGDVLHHYPHGKAFICEDLSAENERFLKKDITITGFLVGGRAMQSEGIAKNIEDEFFAEALPFMDKLDGARRFAWNFVEDFEYRYKEEDAHFELNFTLQKGSYATVVLEEILGRFLDESC